MATAARQSWNEWRTRRIGPRSSDDAVRLARTLGWFSVGLGVAQLAMPRVLGAAVGVQRPGTMRALGLREIAAGAAILARPREPALLWSRVAGDAMDLALLGAAFGARDARRGRLTVALATIGAVTAVDVAASRRLSAAVTGQHAAPVEISLSVGVDRPADELYRFWRNLSNLPRFMSTVREVRPLDGLSPEQSRRWHWVALGPGGTSPEWDSEITEERPGQLLAWRSTPGRLLASEGTVHFTSAPNGEGTLVRLRLRYAGAGGAATAAIARLLRQLPRQQLKGELRRFKQLIETGEIATIDGQSSGRRSAMVQWLQRVVPKTRKTTGAGADGAQDSRRWAGRSEPAGRGQGTGGSIAEVSQS